MRIVHVSTMFIYIFRPMWRLEFGNFPEVDVQVSHGGVNGLKDGLSRLGWKILSSWL